MPIRISVVIPVYNTGPYLRECLDSVVEQTLDAELYEVIAIDDGSTDSSPAILDEYAERVPNVRIRRIEASGSAARPRNIGIEMARGDYVFFVDADDTIAPSTLERLLAVADETGSDMVLCRMENMPGGTRMVPRSVFLSERRAEDFVESFAYRTLGPTKLYRLAHVRQHGLRFVEGYRNGEDLPFTMESFLLANHISAISDQPYYFVRTRTEGRNTSRLGQPPADNLTKNLNVIAVVERRTEPGDRRNELMVRSFTFGPGLTRSFQAEFLELAELERRRLVDRAADGAAHLWNDYLRERSESWKRAMLEAVFTRDYSEVEELARSHGRPLAVELDPDSGTFLHRSATGQVTHGYRPALAGSLVGHEVVGEELLTHVRWQVPGVSEPPDRVALVWRHRELPVERRFVAGDLEPDREAATLRTDLAALSKHGSWDAFLEVGWGKVDVRQRLGHRQQESNDPSGVGAPSRGVVFFTEYGNISYDSGGTRRIAVRDRPLRLVKVVPRGVKTLLLIEDSIAGTTDEEIDVAVSVFGRTITFRRPARRVGPTVLMAQYPVPFRGGLTVTVVRGASRSTVLVAPSAAW